MMMWCKYFLEAQGYTVDSNVLYQDNKSTILLAKNGRMSAGKNSKHIQNRFFLVTDKIAKGDLEVKYAPTKQMWADANTKPLQGQLFREMRSRIMGCGIEYDDDEERRSTHASLLPRVKEQGVISKEDVEVLRKATGIKQGATSQKSIPQKDRTSVGRRSVLDSEKYGSGSRPLWAPPGAPRFPYLTKALRAIASGPLG